MCGCDKTNLGEKTNKKMKEKMRKLKFSQNVQCK